FRSLEVAVLVGEVRFSALEVVHPLDHQGGAGCYCGADGIRVAWPQLVGGLGIRIEAQSHHCTPSRWKQNEHIHPVWTCSCMVSGLRPRGLRRTSLGS